MAEQDRDEYLRGCKDRALEYLDAGDLVNAVASMSSDLGKHSAFRNPAAATLTMVGMMEIQNGPDAVRRWINGFH